MMRFRLQKGGEYIDVDVYDAYELNYDDVREDKLNPIIRDIIFMKGLVCDGCGKDFYAGNGQIRDWVSIPHRKRWEDDWAIYLFCFDTKSKCVGDWMEFKDGR